VKALNRSLVTCAILLSTFSLTDGTGPGKNSWRYYRPGNTGIQGDYCDALWIGADGDPWIGGYDPGFEEGGLAKFVQAENRWINVSNVDYREIGHPNQTGVTRVRDITPDAQGNLWMGTGRGVLRFNPIIGPKSLKRFDATNSQLPGGWMTNIEVTPDGKVWASGYATVWGGGGSRDSTLQPVNGHFWARTGARYWPHNPSREADTTFGPAIAQTRLV